MRPVTVRRIAQTFFVLLLIWSCLVTTVGERWFELRGWPVSWLLELDPLVGLATVLTTGTLYKGLLWGAVTLAATALINLGREALVPLLQGLEGNSDSIWFRDGAHHVLRSLVRDGVADEAMPVLEALEDIEPCIGAPIAAYHVLQELRGHSGTRSEILS